MHFELEGGSERERTRAREDGYVCQTEGKESQERDRVFVFGCIRGGESRVKQSKRVCMRERERD